MYKYRGYIISILYKVYKIHNDHHLFEDLVSSGVLGIEKANKIFDPNLNDNFLGFAYYYIIREIRQTLGDIGDSCISQPVNKLSNLSEHNYSLDYLSTMDTKILDNYITEDNNVYDIIKEQDISRILFEIVGDRDLLNWCYTDKNSMTDERAIEKIREKYSNLLNDKAGTKHKKTPKYLKWRLKELFKRRLRDHLKTNKRDKEIVDGL